MGTLQIILGGLFVVICLLLIVVVLLQKGRGGGLGAAFGGAGSSAFGTKTGDVLTWVTIILTGVFLLLASINVLAFRPPSPTVARPEVSAAATDNGTLISLAAATKDAVIHYTLDGTDPVATSATYEKMPILVKSGQVLKARGMRHGYLPSPVTVWPTPVPAAAETQPSASEPAEATTMPTTAPAL
ncbi:MAG: preprotein translocase subunit SecG [Phycisphaerae bacterium]|jgi:preprotein translocase subunit SecG